eukprot:794540_1
MLPRSFVSKIRSCRSCIACFSTHNGVNGHANGHTNGVKLDKERTLLPSKHDFTRMTLDALKYIQNDIYHFQDNADQLQSGSGYRYLHSKDCNEFEQVKKIYDKFQEDLPMHGMEFSDALQLFFKEIHFSVNDNQPGYMGFVPSGGLAEAAIGDFIASTTNRFPILFQCFPAGSSIEQCLVRWFAQIIGPPFSDEECGGGYLTSGGSMSSLMALNVIRDFYMDEDSDLNINQLTLYCSDQTHHSVHQSVKFVGIPLSNIRTITSNKYTKQIDIRTLKETICSDIRNGFKPVAIVGNAGTTNTAAIDDLKAIHCVCEEYDLWFHVDGAYGGFFNLTRRGQAALDGIQFADSIVLDPHKTLFMPYGTGCLLVKNINYLIKANQFSGSYHPDKRDDFPYVDLCDLSFELTRSFRGLGPWLALKTIGFDRITEELDNKLDLKEYCVDYIQNRLRCSTSQLLTIVCFHAQTGHGFYIW